MNNLVKINRIIDYYLCNNLILDENAVNSIVFLYLEYMGLLSEVRCFKVSNIPNSTFKGYYSPCEKSLVIDINAIIKWSYSWYNQNPDFSCINFVNFVNYNIIHCIFHELKHVNQIYLFSKEKNVANEIVTYVDRIMKENYNFYIEKHELFPLEKDANMFAHSMAISKFMKIDHKIVSNQEIMIYIKYFLNYIIRNYNPNSYFDNPLKEIVISSSPSYDRENSVNDYYAMQRDILNVNYDLYDRLSLNFPITKEEYDYMISLINNCNYDKMKRNTDVKKLILGGK